MSVVKDKETDKTVNIEGILADFFLKKMNGSKSESWNYEKKRKKKDKKHKTKKSRHKRSRSCSSEEKSKDYMKCVIDHSSSEEKDIKRLQRLKRLDTKDNNLNIVSTVGSEDNESKIKLQSFYQSDILYGPSLQTLLGLPNNDGHETINSEVNIASKDKINTEASKNTTVADIIGNKINIEANNTIDGVEAQTNENIKGSLNLDKDEAKANTVLSDNKNDAKSTISKGGVESGDIKHSVNVHGSNSEAIESKRKKKSDRYSRSRSRSRSYGSEKHSKSYKSRRHSRSRSNSRSKSFKDKKISRSRNRSRSRSYSRHKRYKSRSRSKEFQKRYRKYPRKDRSRSTSRRRRRSRSRSSSRRRDASWSQRRRRSRSHSYERSCRSPDKDSKHKSKSYNKRSSSREHDSSRKKRSRSKSPDKHSRSTSSLKIDQAKILEIAQKNVLSMIEKGTLPEGLSLDNFKKEQILSLKAGGKSVQELTDFCTKLSKKENDPVAEDKDDAGNNAESGFIHHPFKIKEASAIKLNIKNSVQIPVRTHAEKVAETARLSSQFPVSSGNKHKQKELEWIPVEPDSKTQKDSDASKALVPLSLPTKAVPIVSKPKILEATNTASTLSPNPVTAAIIPPVPLPPPPPPPPPPPEITVPVLPPPPLPPPLPPSLPPSSLLSTVTPVAVPEQPHVTLVDYPMIPTNSYSFVAPSQYPVTSEMNTFYTQVQYPNIVSANEQPTVYPVTTSHSTETTSFQPKKPIDVSAIVAQRFKALTKLQTNPNDTEALQTLEQAQASINDWVQSQEVPGLFTGSTGAKLLSVEELSGPRHWNYRAKKRIGYFLRTLMCVFRLRIQSHLVASPQFNQETEVEILSVF
nr:protein Son isoform X2 [Parasteatoda tepidariorum]